jgi:DNA-binding winged helix-turn-helix (wHTH) protein/tetratricopeptide (TPR) repeat protein
MSLPDNEIYRFDEFELDRRKRNLLRNGEPIPLSPKAFEVLVQLVCHAGTVVTKEQIISAVWPESFVEEGNLAQHVSALRRAFGDRADYIVTVPGRGYQFTANVTAVRPTQVAAPALQPTGSTMAVQITRERAVMIVDEELLSQPTRPWYARATFWLAAAAVLSLGAWLGWRHFHHPSYGHATAVLAQLDNETGDAEFDNILNRVLQIDLQQSPYFSVVSESRARRTLVMMRQPGDEPLTPSLARDVCQRLNGQIYLAPTIAKLGDHYLLTLQANDCGDSHLLGAGHEEVASKDRVLAAFSSLTSQVRGDAGEAASSIHAFNKPVYDEPTSSFEALKTYSEATRLGDSGQFAASIALYQHAVELDPNFALAYVDMSSMYYNIGDSPHDKAAVTRAYALRDTVNVRERFLIIYRYNQSVTGDLEAMLSACRGWSAMYPEDNIPLADLVNFETWIGSYSTATGYADRMLDLEERQNIHNGITYEIAARAYNHANMPDKVRAVYAAAQQWNVITQGMTSVMIEFADENNNQAEIDRLVGGSRGTPAEARVLQIAAMAAMAKGQVARSDDLFAQATSAAERDKVTDSLADQDDYRARMLTELGLTAKAKTVLASISTIDTSLDRAFAEAAVGDTARALGEAAKAQSEAPHDTLMNAEYVPSVRALVDLQQGNSAEAVKLLEQSAPYELRDPTVPYLRGQAFLAAHQPDNAATEFTKLADHPFLADPPAPLVVLAHLGLAHAYVMSNNSQAAKKEYEALFELWKDADKDLPILLLAHEEYERLRQRHE